MGQAWPQGGVVAGPSGTGTRRRRGEGPHSDERRAFQAAPLPPQIADALLVPGAPNQGATVVPDTQITDTLVGDATALRPDGADADTRRLWQAWPLVDAGLWRRKIAQALTDEVEFGTPFLLIPVLLIAGIALYFTLPVEPALHNIPLAMLLLGAVWIWYRRRARIAGHAMLAALLILAGMGIAQWHTHARGTQMLGSEVATTLTGRIVRIEARANGSVRYTLDVLKTERPELRYAPDRLRVTARNPIEGVRVGDGLSGLARLRPASGPARPGGYDFAFHGYFAGHGANGFFYGPPEAVSVPRPDSIGARAAIGLQNARLWLGDRIRQAAPGQAGTVAAALVNGDKSAIPESVNEALRISGLAHILTISGLHMALVAVTVMTALRAGLALSEPLASGHAIRKYAALAGFIAIFFYLFLAGAGIATQRSFVMLAVMLCALMLDRRAISKRNLAIAAIIILALSPASVVGPSFHMSFAATLALIALYDVWNRSRANRLRNAGWRPRSRAASLGLNTWRFFAALAATSIVAGAASGLYAAYHFQRVAVLGLVTNLAAMPIVSLITMPLAVAATLAIPFGLDGPLYALMAKSAGWILATAEWVAARSPDGMVGAMSDAAMLTATAALVWFCVCRTWLRWGALLPALIALVILTTPREQPLAIISEDGRQFAIIDPSGALAVNRKRPNGFIIEQWRMAYAARTIIKPTASDDPLADMQVQPSQVDGVDPETTGETARSSDVASSASTVPMHCDEALCVATINRGGERYHTAIISAAPTDPADHLSANSTSESLCGQFDLIILAYAPAQSFCSNTTLVLTAQDLALKGSAEIRTNPRYTDKKDSHATATAEARLTVAHAVQMPFRPWHDHRRWSRSARNLESRR